MSDLPRQPILTIEYEGQHRSIISQKLKRSVKIHHQNRVEQLSHNRAERCVLIYRDRHPLVDFEVSCFTNTTEPPGSLHRIVKQDL